MALEKRRQDSNDNVHQAVVLYYTLTETTIVSCRAPFLCDLDGAGYQNRRRNHGSHSDSSNRLVAAAISFKPNWNAGTAVSILTNFTGHSILSTTGLSQSRS